MNNYKGFIDNVIKALEDPMIDYTIEKTVNNKVLYVIDFKPSAGPFAYTHDKDKIRDFADDLLFGLQGKSPLPHVTITGNCDAFNDRYFMQSLFSKIKDKEHRDYLFNIFHKKLTPSTSLKALVRTKTHNDSPQIIEEIICYMLNREAKSENKSLEKLSGILQSLRHDNNYEYNNYKKELIEFLNSYEPLIIENDKNHLGNLIKPREEIAKYVGIKESPSKYQEYRRFLPIVAMLNQPEDNLFSVSQFKLYNFDLSFVSLINDNSTLLSYDKIKDHIQLVINSINSYLNEKDVKGLVQIGEMSSFNKADYKTNIWFKIDENICGEDISETIKIGQTLFTKVSEYHKQLVLEDSANVNIEEALTKGVPNFVLDIIIPNKDTQKNNKIKI